MSQTPTVEHESSTVQFRLRAPKARTTPSWKRTMDVAGAVVLGILSAPLLLLLAAYIKSVSKGPVIFRQERLGLGAKPFQILKFRTMHIDEGAASHRDYLRGLTSTAPISKPDYASRLIPGGALMRRLSLDELPQLWNVFTGEMSLVGPRPDVLWLEDYETNYELRRFEVLPGMTGLWQVSGKNDLSFGQMIDLDVRYVDQLSPMTDIWILSRTVFVLAFGANS